MNKYIIHFICMLLISQLAVTVHADQPKIAIRDFPAVGVERPQEINNMLRSLLSSRLAAKGLNVVENEKSAATINGGYYASGRTFSIDVVVSGPNGEKIGQKFVQGNTQDDLIPAVSKLAEQIYDLLVQQTDKSDVTGLSVNTVAKANAQAVRQVKTQEVASSEGIIRSEVDPKKVQQLARIEGVLIGIAPFRRLATGGLEFVVADDHTVYLYRKTEELKKIAEFPLQGAGKILALDTGDADGDGELEIYVTVMDREELVSLVIGLKDSKFYVIAEKLALFFRAVELNGQKRQIIAQQTGRGADDFYGDVRYVEKKGNTFTLGASVKLAGKADAFSFNAFNGGDGKQRTIVIDSGGRLHVNDETGKQLWKSLDKFGGSETYFLRDEQQYQNIALDRYRWHFIEKRIIVTKNGEIIVPQNSGSFVVGNSRSYDKNSVYAFVWNGVSLEEIWHTKESAGYLADYYFDAENGELVSVVQVQKEGLFSKGASAIVIKTINK